MGSHDIHVTTTTGALGTQADIVVVSLVRNNSKDYRRSRYFTRS